MPGVCCVQGCKSRFEKGGKHFFRFPKDLPYKQLWIQFTRRSELEVKKCSAICENHFAAGSIISKKKGRFYLLKGTCPTIYYRELGMGSLLRIIVEFDPVTCQYVGKESVNLIQYVLSAEEERNLQEERRRKVQNLKSLCRFCFESENEKFVSITKLEAYSIDPDEILTLLGLKSECSGAFSEIVCEQCFQSLALLDSFIKRCRKAQDEIISGMQELDNRLSSGNEKKVEPWYECVSAEQNLIPLDIIEEHLDDNISYVGGEDENYEVFKVEQFDTFASIEKGDDVIMQETFEDQFDEQFEEIEEEEMKEDEPEEEEEDEEGSQEDQTHEDEPPEAVVRNPEINSFALRVYECFFCRQKFAGKKTYKYHECRVKEVKCEVEGCSKYFNKLSGYNTHVVKVHGLLKTSKHYCPICRNVIMATEVDFKKHCRDCDKELDKKEHPIECELCKKKCPNLKSYTVHKLFHDARNLVGGKEASNPKLPVICELCGKDFTNAQGLRTHKKNVHRIGQPKGIVYQCDICSKQRPTKRSLFNHMRNVHRVREAPCSVCGKVFRTPALLQKHMMYHDETKRVHRCPMCPDKPGWFTNVALKRHQKSNHMGVKEFHCDAELCDATFSSNALLKHHKANLHTNHRIYLID